MIIVHGTKKFRDRVRGRAPAADDASTGRLGAWYANVLFFKPQVALFVSEETLVPLLMPLAPASDLVDRFPDALEELLVAHGLPQPFIGEKVAADQVRVAPTASRSVLGVMNEFAYLARYRVDAGRLPDLVAVSMDLARTPTRALFARHGSPDRELRALATGP